MAREMAPQLEMRKGAPWAPKTALAKADERELGMD